MTADDHRNTRSETMSTCETCGNRYDNTFTVTLEGKSHEFDSFECAIAALAPLCDRCGVRILGHGVESEDGATRVTYCSAHCARASGESAARDHVRSA